MKSVPMRTCMGCYEAKPKKELIRIVKSSDNDILVDFTGKKDGRGAYICHSVECLEKVIKTKKLSKAFAMAISDEIYEKLKEEILSEKEV